MRFFRRNSDNLTRRLSSARFSLVEPERRRIAWMLIPAILASSGAAYAVAMYVQSPEAQAETQMTTVMQEAERLQRELKLTQMRVQQEVATREELSRQMETLTQKLRAAETELEFFRRQRAATRSQPQGAPNPTSNP